MKWSSKSPERLYLIGMMGSGKSFVGKALADAVDLHFVDLDQEIERTTGLSIAQIFAAQGEAHFRVLERDMLRSTIALSGVVIATGGGAPCHWDGMAFIRTAGISCYLRASVTTLVTRMRGEERQLRPLLNGDPGARLETLLKERAAIYEQADHIIDVDDRTSHDIVTLLCEKIAAND